MKRIVVFLFAILLQGCGDEITVQSQRWSASGSGSSSHSGYGKLQKLVSEVKDGASYDFVAGKTYLRTPQIVDGIPVENTWFQEIIASNGDVESFSFRLVEEVSEEVLDVAKQLERSQQQILSQLKDSNEIYAQSDETYKVHAVIVPYPKQVAAFLKVDFLAPDGLSVYSYYLDESADVKRVRRIHHEFANGVAYVFYSAPDESEISQQPLFNLKEDGSLSSSHLTVESAIQQTPRNSNHIFRYQENQKEFDLVQSYFFVDQTIQWFKSQIETELGYPLNLKVHIGGENPTNAAFFYSGNIRLGVGDGKVYKGIPRDPSIVTHETSHAYVQKLSGLDFEGEAGSYSEAFSDFFTACRLKRAEMGFYAYLKAPFKRTLDNNLRADRDLQGKKYNDSLVISATFWDIKKILGTEKALIIAKEFLMELGPGGKIAELPEVLLSVATRILPSEDHHVIESILEQRGWR